jgi:hypothetical protein
VVAVISHFRSGGFFRAAASGLDSAASAVDRLQDTILSFSHPVGFLQKKPALRRGLLTQANVGASRIESSIYIQLGFSQ